MPGMAWGGFLDLTSRSEHFDLHSGFPAFGFRLGHVFSSRPATLMPQLLPRRKPKERPAWEYFARRIVFMVTADYRPKKESP